MGLGSSSGRPRPILARAARGHEGKKARGQVSRRAAGPWVSRAPLDRRALDNAKARFGISAAWRALGLPGEPARVCKSPFRDERHPSFSITGDALWHDLAEGTGGDVVSFVKRATACDDAEAIRRVVELAGGTVASFTLAPRLPAITPARPPFDGLAGLDVKAPTLAEIHTLQSHRAWPVNAGLELAAVRGLLRVADVRHRGETHRAWLLTDNARKSAQARRLDGEPWPGDGFTFKSKSLRADPDHPPGLADVVGADRPAVLICEGEPDTLAGLTFAWLAGLADKVGVVCLAGASKGIPPAICSALAGRRVRILRQTDAAGHRSALVWAESLHAAGIACDLANLDGLHRADGLPAKDAADLLRRPADVEDLARLAAHILDNLLP
jgi:hypothetical protein